MGVEFNLSSRDAQVALEEFSQEFAAAYEATPVREWAKELGLYRASGAMKTTFPIPVSAAGYHELLGDVKYRKLLEKSLELVQRTWQDGVEELASIIEAPDFIGWAGEPERIAAAGKSLHNELIAAALEANAVHPLDGKTLFASDHPVNVFKASVGTFDNDIEAGATKTGIGLAKQYFRSIKAANGKPLGLRLTHILAPAAQEEAWKDVLEQDMTIEAIGDSFGAVDNRHKGTVNLVISDELTSDDYSYGLALNKPGSYPWICQDQGAPEELRSDKTSDYYKRTLKIALAYIMRANAAIALPQAVVRLSGTDPT